jgi:erythromycin esterase
MSAGQQEQRFMSRATRRFIALVCLLSVSIGLPSCNGPPPSKVEPAPTLSATQSWIKQHAIVLKTTDPRAPLDDLLPLQPLIGTASLVGLGEATHGSHEIFTMKHRLLEFLVERMGFTMFAMEGGWSAGEQINQYVLTGQGDAAQVLQQFGFWVWNTQEVLDLLKWMRAYNADSQHARKIAFAGFDCQIIEANTYESVMQYFQAVDPRRVATVAALYQGLRPEPGVSTDTYGNAYAHLPPSTLQRYVTKAQQVYGLLTQQKAAYEKRSSPQAFALAIQQARVIVQHAQFFSISSAHPDQAGSFRDEAMAENTAWLHEQTPSGKKLALWAHEGHLATGEQPAMGWYLRQRYGSSYLAVGTSFYEGSFNAHGLDNKRQVTPVQPFHVHLSEPGSYNDTFGHLGLSLFALDLRHLADGATDQWVQVPHYFAMIGALYEGSTDSYMSLIFLPHYFDVLIHIQKVTASHLLPLPA